MGNNAAVAEIVYETIERINKDEILCNIGIRVFNTVEYVDITIKID